MFDVSFVTSTSLSLGLDLTHPDHPALTVKVTNRVRLAGSEDGVLLDVIVNNHLPCVWSLLFLRFTYR